MAAARKRAATKPAGRRFGRPGTAGKGEGDEAVRAWLAGVDPKHRALVEKLDALIGRTVPGVRRAVKWSMPMYGVAGQGFFAHIAPHKEYVALGFFDGANLDPPPPEGEGKSMRRVNLRSAADYDEKRFASWIRQASQRKGWGKA